MTSDQLKKSIEKVKDYFNSHILVNIEKSSAKKLESPSVFKKNLKIYSKSDPDGLISSTILSIAFQRLKIGHHIHFVSPLTFDLEEYYKQAQMQNHFVIFLNIGINHSKKMHDLFKDINYIIIDHHHNVHLKNSEENIINPFLFDVNGYSEICTAGLVYLFVRSLNEVNHDLHYLALIGGLCEYQNINPKATFTGMNLEIMKAAEIDGKIKTDVDIAVSKIRPIDQALAFTLPVEINPISNNLEEAQKFLQKIQVRYKNEINDPRNLQDLSDREKKSILNGLIQTALVESGLDRTITTKFIRTFYFFTQFQDDEVLSDGYELIHIISACSKLKHHDLALALLLGNKEAQKEAKEISQEFDVLVKKSIKTAKANIQQYSHLTSFYHESIDEKILDTISSVISRTDYSSKKPIFGLCNYEKGKIKVVANYTDNSDNFKYDFIHLMNNINNALNSLEPVGGIPNKATTLIQNEHKESFLQLANNMIKNQIK